MGRRGRRRASQIIVLTTLLFVAAARAGAARELIDRVLALVGDEVITLSDVSGAISIGFIEVEGVGDPTGAALGQLIEHTLMLVEVDRYSPPEPDAALVERRLAHLRGRFASGEAFATALAVAGLDEARLRGRVRDELRIQAYLDQRFTAAAQPTDEEVARYYREHQGEFIKDGRPLSSAEAEEIIRPRLAAERRRAQIAEWIAGLRRRAEITHLYFPTR